MFKKIKVKDKRAFEIALSCALPVVSNIRKQSDLRSIPKKLLGRETLTWDEILDNYNEYKTRSKGHW